MPDCQVDPLHRRKWYRFSPASKGWAGPGRLGTLRQGADRLGPARAAGLRDGARVVTAVSLLNTDRRQETEKRRTKGSRPNHLARQVRSDDTARQSKAAAIRCEATDSVGSTNAVELLMDDG
jgi:hypothetical protein